MPHLDVEDELSFLVTAVVVLVVVLAVWAALASLPAQFSLSPEIIGAVKLAVTGGASWFLKIAYDKYKDRGAVKTARSLIAEELKHAYATCDDKISDWKARLSNADEGPTDKISEIVLYPNISTIAFEAVADKAVKMDAAVREPVFKAYYDLIRRRDNSRRVIRAPTFRQHGQDAIAEIERLKGLITTALEKLKD